MRSIEVWGGGASALGESHIQICAKVRREGRVGLLFLFKNVYSSLTLFEPQSRFGDKLRGTRDDFPQIRDRGSQSLQDLPRRAYSALLRLLTFLLIGVARSILGPPKTEHCVTCFPTFPRSETETPSWIPMVPKLNLPEWDLGFRPTWTS